MDKLYQTWTNLKMNSLHDLYIIFVRPLPVPVPAVSCSFQCQFWPVSIPAPWFHPYYCLYYSLYYRLYDSPYIVYIIVYIRVYIIFYIIVYGTMVPWCHGAMVPWYHGTTSTINRSAVGPMDAKLRLPRDCNTPSQNLATHPRVHRPNNGV